MNFRKNIHYSQELEQAILGACLLEKLAMGRTYGVIEPESFYFESHQVVYRAIKEMYDSSLPIDCYTVADYITVHMNTPFIQEEESLLFVCRLTNLVVSSAHLEYHCHIVKEMWRRRRVIELRSTVSDETDTRISIQQINEELQRISSTEFRQDWYDMEELMFNLMLHQNKMANGEKSFVTTGFKKVDKLNGGFYNGQMVVIGARPSVGKSALMGQMAIKMAQSGKKVGIISLEMNNNEIAARLSSIETSIDFSLIFRDIARDEELHKRFYDQIRTTLIKLPIFLSDKTKVNVPEIKAKAIKLKATKGCDCIMIDYLQLIDSHTDNKNYNREQEVAKMSRGLKLMAQELDIPVIVLCQLNRAVTGRAYKDRFPKLSDLRESGSIEQDADVVMFIHRDFMSGFTVDEENNSTELTADLLGTKWRNGATFHLPLDFDPPKMKFSERMEFKGYTPVNSVLPTEKDMPF